MPRQKPGLSNASAESSERATPPSGPARHDVVARLRLAERTMQDARKELDAAREDYAVYQRQREAAAALYVPRHGRLALPAVLVRARDDAALGAWTLRDIGLCTSRGDRLWAAFPEQTLANLAASHLAGTLERLDVEYNQSGLVRSIRPATVYVQVDDAGAPRKDCLRVHDEIPFQDMCTRSPACWDELPLTSVAAPVRHDTSWSTIRIENGPDRSADEVPLGELKAAVRAGFIVNGRERLDRGEGGPGGNKRADVLVGWTRALRFVRLLRDACAQEESEKTGRGSAPSDATKD